MLKTMPDELKSVLNNVIKAMNLIKANALNSRLFADLRKENYSDFKTLLLHSHVRWLSKGKVLKKSFVLRKEIHKFLYEATNNVQKILRRQLSDMLFRLK